MCAEKIWAPLKLVNKTWKVSLRIQRFSAVSIFYGVDAETSRKRGGWALCCVFLVLQTPSAPRSSALPSLHWGWASALPFVWGLNDTHQARPYCRQFHHCGSKVPVRLWSRLGSQLAICKGQTQQDSCYNSKSDFNGRQVALGFPILFAEVA